MLKLKLTKIEHFQNNISSLNLDLSSFPIRLQRTYTFELADDFNDGVLSSQWLRQSPSVPIETGGYLQFSYPDYEPQNSQVIFNSLRGMYELETRFICESISNNVLPYSDYFVPFGPAILGAPILTPPLTDTQYEQNLVWGCWTNWSPYTNFLAFLPFCYDRNGVKYMWKQSENRWVIDPGPSGRQPVFLNNPAQIPITLKATISGDGIVIKAYKNDNPTQVIFETAQSPALRTFDNYYLQLAHAPNFGGGRTKYDYFKLSGPVFEPDYGELIIRKTFPIKSKIISYELERVLNNSDIELKMRCGNALESLNNAEFKLIDPELLTNNTETGRLNLPEALYYDFKFEFIKTLQSPLLNSFGFTVIPSFVFNDEPAILSLDEAGPKLAMVTSSEEGLSETLNTRKIIDGDINTQWVSLNASDTLPVTLQITFLSSTGGNELRNINCLILRNTNIKDIRIHCGVTTLFEGELLEDNVIIPFDLISTPIIQIEAKTTRIAEQNKKIGECYCGQILAILPGFDSYQPEVKYFENGLMRTIGGKLLSYRGSSKYQSKWKVITLDKELTEKLKDIFKNEPFVTFWAEPRTKPAELFDVSWNMSAFAYIYSSQFKGAGYDIEVEMTEL